MLSVGFLRADWALWYNRHISSKQGLINLTKKRDTIMTTTQKPVSITFSPTKSIDDTLLSCALNDLACLSASSLIEHISIGTNGNDESVGVRSGSYKLTDVLSELCGYLDAPAELSEDETLLDEQDLLDAMATHSVLVMLQQDEAIANGTINIEGATESSIFMNGTWDAKPLLFTMSKLVDIAIIMHSDESQLRYLGVFGS